MIITVVQKVNGQKSRKMRKRQISTTASLETLNKKWRLSGDAEILLMSTRHLDSDEKKFEEVQELLIAFINNNLLRTLG
jgi:hypothetical protein